MRLRSLLHRFDVHGERQRAKDRPRRSRLDLMSLEDRALPAFITAPAYPADVQPYSVKTGDFDGDGDLDLATANYYPGTVSVWLGNGDGTFQTRSDYPASGFNLRSLVVADFNRDGALDLAAIYDQVYVLPGNGDGTFQTARTFSAGGVPMGMSVGDFNGDDCPDLAVSNGGGVSVGVLLGNGDGTFGEPRTFAAGISHDAVAVGDFNGDGRDDLATTNNNPDGYRVNVLLGNGDGTFGAVRSFPVGNEPWSVAVGDFDGDGLQDLAVANRLGHNVSVLLSLGDGTFRPRVNYAVGMFPDFVTVGDWDGDGDDDLATANGSNTVSVLQGQGDGTFQAGGTFAVGAVPSSLAVGDFDRDGDLDLAAANTNTLSNSVSVLLGDGEGAFAAPRSFRVGKSPSAVTAGDFNGDGFEDLAVANYHSEFVSVLLNRGDNTFHPAVNYALGIYASAVAVADFNGDGHLDLAVCGAGLNVFVGRGDGTFQAGNFLDGGGDVAVGDFNNDGILDLVTEAGLLLGNGDGTFQARLGFWAGLDPFAIAVGDFDRDGQLDLAVSNYAASYMVSVVLGNGDGTFQAPVHYGHFVLWTDLAVDDFNGDGALDLAVTSESVPDGIASVYLGNGDGSLRAANHFSAGPGEPRAVAASDFDGDGILDLALATGYAGAPDGLRVLPGQGDGTFRAPVGYNAGVMTRAMAVGDFNGDSWPDVAVTNWDASTTTVLLNEGGSVTIDQAAGQPDPTAGATVAFDVTFSQPVTGFDAADVDLSGSTVGGTLVPAVAGSGSVYTITVTGMSGAGTVVASIPAGAAEFAPGVPTPASTSTDNTVTFDLPPTVTVDQAIGQSDPTSGPAITFDVKFNEPVTGFDAADVSLMGSTAGGTLSAAVSGSLDTYTVTVTGMTTRGLVVATVPAGAATDALGSPNHASTSTDNAVEFRQPGTIGFTQAVYHAAEDGPTAAVTVSRTGPTDGEVSVKYSTNPGTAHADTDYTPASGTLTWADGEGGDKTFTVPILPDSLNEGKELFHVSLTDPSGLPGLGLSTAVVAIAPSDGAVINAASVRPLWPFARFTDTDGDVATVRLGGRTGTATVYRTDPDGDGRGPIEWIELADTLPDPLRPKAALVIGVTKAKTSVDGGTIGLGAVTGTGLKSMSARRANLDGEGINLNGYLGSLVIGNVSHGADIVTGPAADSLRKTRISALAIGDGTAIDVGAHVSRLTAASFGTGAVRAPSIGALTIRGNMAADVTVTGAGVDSGRKALAALRVNGTMTGSDISVSGHVGTVVVGSFRNSRLFAGYAGPDIPDPAGFYMPATVGVFRTTARFDGFQNSHLVATAFRTVVLNGLDAANDGTGFGVYADASLGVVSVLSPTRLRYDSVAPEPEGIGDFEVMLV